MELEIRAFDPAVVELPSTVGLLTYQGLEVRVRREQIMRPGLQPLQHVGYGPIEVLHLVEITHPQAVRRVADDAAEVLLAAELGEVVTLEVDLVGHAGRLSVESGKPQCLFVDVVADNSHGQIGQHGISRLGSGRRPKIGRYARPRLGRKLAMQTRGHVPSDQSRLDRNRPRPTKRIDQRPVGTPETQHDHGRREGLFQRGSAGQRAITPLVQAGTRRVDGQRRQILQEGHFDRHPRTRLFEQLDAVGLLELLDDRLLHDLLAGRHAGQLRLDRSAFDGKLGVGGNPLVPG